jgi:hypothetical protein
MTFYSFVRKMETVFGPRRLDRIRVLVPCFRPLGLLGGLWWQGFFPGPSQRIPQVGILTIWNEFLRFWGAPRPPIGAHSLLLFRLFSEA